MQEREIDESGSAMSHIDVGLSSRYLAQRACYAQSLYAALLALIAAALLVLYNQGGGAPLRSGLPLIGLLLALGLTLVLHERFTRAHLQAMRVATAPEGIVRIFHRRRVQVPWGTIRAIRATYARDGGLHSISLSLERGAPVLLVGFEDLDAILHVIDRHAPSSASRKQALQRLNWLNPLWPWAMAAVASIASALVALHGVGQVLELAGAGIQLALGALLIAGHPASRFNIQFRAVEIGTGVVCIVIGAARLLWAL